MSILDTVKREVVDFNPTDQQHRQWAHTALTTNSWGRCPVRFRTRNMTDMENTVKRELLEFYLTNEFG